MLRRYPSILVLTFITLACGMPLWNARPLQPEPPFSPPRSLIDFRAISVSHGGCLGPCPIYQFVLRRQGLSQYHGGPWAVFEGDYVGTISTPAFDHVARFLIDQRFFDAPSESCIEVDAPVTTVAVELLDGRTKHVAYGFCDAQSILFGLAGVIDSVAAKVLWRPGVP
jgi:hypothetical protein